MTVDYPNRLVPSPLALALCIVLFGARAHADAPQTGASDQGAAPSRETDAARAFEEGVRQFRRAEYAAAAAAFLRADELAPSADALENAIAAARRANAHLLVVTISRRALSRESAAPSLAANAREALALAERHLSRLELGCVAVSPCALVLDGSSVDPGTVHVLPGLHTVSASTERGERVELRLEAAAGASYQLQLRPVAAATPRARVPPSRAPVADSAAKKPLPQTAFWISLGVTGALAGVTTWSGIDTLGARNSLPDTPTRAEVDDVRGRIQRTDILVVATAVLAAITTYGGVALVDWETASPSASRGPVISF